MTHDNPAYDKLSDAELSERVCDSVIVGMDEYSTEQDVLEALGASDE